MSVASRTSGFSIVELLIVVAITSILAGIGTPLYVGWRAADLNSESVQALKSAVAGARSESKRAGTAVILTFEDGSTTFMYAGRRVELPHGGTLGVESSPLEVTFSPPLGSQTPFESVSLEVTTGQGPMERTASVSILPPLGKTGISK